jgi:histidine triad (HIT) family protein
MLKQLIFLSLLALPLVVNGKEETSVFLNASKDKWVLESANAFVLEDKYPQAPVHLLVIPKQLVKTTLDATPELLGEMLQLAKDAARKYGIAKEGFRIVINTNPEGGQHVYHLHIHILGGRQMTWPPG